MAKNDTSTGDSERDLFWAGAPLTVRSDLYHIYDEETNRSLCGRYRHQTLNDTSPVEDNDNWRDGKDCKSCCRKAGLLNPDTDQ